MARRFYPTVELAPGADLTDLPENWSWTDLTQLRYVHEPSAISIRRGRQDRYAQTAPAQCNLTLLNPAGIWVPDNPLGTYYGLIDQNTPLRVLMRPNTNSLSDAFGRTASSSWGSADSGGAWTNTGGSASDFSVAAASGGRHTHPTVSVGHYSLLSLSVLRVDMRVRVRVNALSTGGSQAAALMCRWVDASNHSRAELLVATTGSITARLVERAAGTDTVNASQDTGLTHSTSAWYWIRLQTGLTTARMKAWLDGTTEPATWLVDGSVGTFSRTAAGTLGVWSRRETSNTNASATLDFDDFSMVDGPRIRFTGFVDNWPTTWADASERQSFAPITASGQLRRIGQAQNLKSAAYRAHTLQVYSGTPLAVGYWPMEDASGATQFASGLTGGPPMIYTDMSPAGSSAIAGSDSLPICGAAATFYAPVPAYASSTSWAVRAVMKFPTSPSVPTGVLAWTTAGTINKWVLTINADGTWTVQGYIGTTEVLAAAAADFLDGYGTTLIDRQIYLTADVTTAGADIFYNFTLNVDNGSVSVQGTYTGTVGNVSGIFHSAYPGLVAGGHVIGHVAVGSDTGLGPYGSYVATGYAGELTSDRFSRLCMEENLPSYFGEILGAGSVIADQQMGQQRTTSLMQQFREVEATEEGVLFDGLQGHVTILPRVQRQNHAVDLVLDHDAGQLAAGFTAVRDDLLLRNDIQVVNAGGSTVPAQDVAGIRRWGVYSESTAINSASGTADVRDHAYWRLNLGKTPALRYPSVTVELHNSRAAALIPSWLTCDIGSRFTLANLPNAYDTADLIIEGYEEQMSSSVWTVRINGSPAQPWSVFTVAGGGNTGRVGSNGSTLATDATSSATSLLVATPTGSLWRTGSVNYDLALGGERITATAVSSAVNDVFSRTVSGGWGSEPTSGVAYVTSPSGDHSVGSGLGQQSHTSVNVFRSAALDVGTGQKSVTVDVSLPVANAASAVITQWICGRYLDNANYYVARLDLTTTGTVMLNLFKRVAGTLTSLGGPGTIATGHAANDWWRVKMETFGSSIKAKAWLPPAAEPDWQVSVTDTDIPAGGFLALLSRLESGNTNTLPVVVSWDNLAVTNPQTFTVVRSVNGVSKSQAANAEVKLWKPGVIAL